MSPREFKDLAILVFGDAWIDELCYRLGVQRRTVLRWADGDRYIPDAVPMILKFWHEGQKNRGVL